MARAVKRKPETRGGTAAEVVGGEHGGSSDAGRRRQGTADRRILRSRYIAVKNHISSAEFSAVSSLVNELGNPLC